LFTTAVDNVGGETTVALGLQKLLSNVKVEQKVVLIYAHILYLMQSIA